MRIILASVLLAFSACAEGLVVAGGQMPLELSASDVARMPHSSTKLEIDGTVAEYQGPLLYDVLRLAGVGFGHAMRGKNMAAYILVTASDGYQVVFSLPEIDPAFGGQPVLLADKRNGVSLPAKELPYRLIAPNDKVRARSVRGVVRIELVKLRQ